MVDTPLRLIPAGSSTPWAEDVNQSVRLFSGITTGGIILRGDLGVRRSPDAPNTDITGRYTVEAQSKAAGGLHFAAPLSGTAVGATPTAANSAVLITDTGIALGTTAGIRFDLERLRIYESGRVDYSEATSLNGELILGGSGASAGALTLGASLTVLTGAAIKLNNAANDKVGQIAANAAGDLVVGGTTSNLSVGGNINWLSGTSFAITLDHAATAARTITVQDLTGTLPLLGAANVGNLIFVDNAHDIGASAATRPRTIYLGTSLDVAAGAQSFTATDITVTAPWTTFTPALAQGAAVTATVNYARYRIFGKTAHVQVKLTATAVGTITTAITITGIPAAIQPARVTTSSPLGTFVVYVPTTAWNTGFAYAPSTTTIGGIAHAQANVMGILGPATALAIGDVVSFNGTYEIA